MSSVHPTLTANPTVAPRTSRQRHLQPSPQSPTKPESTAHSAEDGLIELNRHVSIPGFSDVDPETGAFGPYQLLPEYSARAVLTTDQLTWAVVAVGAVAIALATSWTTTVAVLIFIANTGFLLSIALKSLPFFIRRQRHDQGSSLPDPPAWPTLTVLCPMAREENVVAQLVESMKLLDYPTDKLQVLFICTESDTQTQDAMPQWLPPHMQLVVVPDAYPQCKPRACGYALWYATGDYVVIFDAEDRVTPSQPKAAMRAFHENQANGDGNLAAVQGRLLFDNDDAGLLPGFFAIEYDQWHSMIVPALAKFGLPVPLGGTSNYFRRAVLDRVGGWDAYNVTEDADLGMRLFAAGWRTGTIPDITYEHAVDKTRAWIGQRSRWTKGYLITALVLLRRPIALVRSIGIRNAMTSLSIVGFIPTLMAIAPLLWALYVLSLFSTDLVDPLFPPWSKPIAVITFYVGLIQSVVAALVAVLPRRKPKLVLLAFFFPLYAMLGSISAVIAMYELLVKPHKWRKTAH